jgi:hypothetical protein
LACAPATTSSAARSGERPSADAAAMVISVASLSSAASARVAGDWSPR